LGKFPPPPPPLPSPHTRCSRIWDAKTPHRMSTQGCRMNTVSNVIFFWEVYLIDRSSSNATYMFIFI
jgi:hypothetical protein